jgi:HEPN domain-containing protein
MDIEKQVSYWLTGSDEDWEVACHLIERGNLRHGLFLIHLALEKILKAHVCKVTQDYPPKIHDLFRLTQKTNLDLSESQHKLFALVNTYCLEGRYPASWVTPPMRDETERVFSKVQEIRVWLKQQL